MADKEEGLGILAYLINANLAGSNVETSDSVHCSDADSCEKPFDRKHQSGVVTGWGRSAGEHIEGTKFFKCSTLFPNIMGRAPASNQENCLESPIPTRSTLYRVFFKMTKTS